MWGLRTYLSSSVTRLMWNGLKQRCVMQQQPSYGISHASYLTTHRLHRPNITRSMTSTPSSTDESGYTVDGFEYSEIKRFAVPEGIASDRFGLYELIDSSKDMRDISGHNCVLAVHGDEKDWLPRGREGHGSEGGMYAIIGTSGTQYKVMAGDILYTNRQQGEVNTQVVFDWVLAIGTFDWTVFGRPLIRDARVLATVEEQTRSAKVMVTKFKKRKGYLRRKGHRQPITRFRIDKIEYELPDASMITPYEVPYDPNKPPLPNHLRNI